MLRQVLTSRNVRGGRVVDFALGGLNYQIEHHLFPSMPRPELAHAQRVVPPVLRAARRELRGDVAWSVLRHGHPAPARRGSRPPLGAGRRLRSLLCGGAHVEQVRCRTPLGTPQPPPVARSWPAPPPRSAPASSPARAPPASASAGGLDSGAAWPDGPGRGNRPQPPDAELRAILGAIDHHRIEATVRTLVSFGTRHTLSAQDDPTRGIGAARDWILADPVSVRRAGPAAGMTVEKQSYVQPPA